MFKQSSNFWCAFLLAALLLTACVPMQAPAAQPTSDEAEQATIAGFPVTIENCGNTLTFERPPERILMTYNPMVELVVGLGLADKIVGVTFGQPVNPPPELADEINSLNWMGPDGYASNEAQIATNPDIVIGTYIFDFGDGSGPTQDEWRELGAEVFLPTSACSPERADTSNLEDAYADILTLGQIFGVEARAEAVVQEMRDRISAVQETVSGRTAVPAILTTAYNGQEPIYVYTGGLTDEFFALAGGSNLFSGSEQAVFAVSKEAFAAEEPAVVLFFEEGDRPDEEEEQRAAFYAENFPNMEAITNGRTAILDAWALQLGIRMADGVEQMARALHPEAFDEAAVPATVAYPVTIENCGNTLTFDKAPERVVSLYPPNTEILLLLGLEEHIVGVGAYNDASYLLPAVRERYAALEPKKLSDSGGVVKEILITAQPDLVTDNQPDYFYNAENGFATAEEVNGTGAQIYTLTAKCGGGRVDATFEDIYTDIQNYGKIFGVEARAEAIIAEMQASIADVQAKIAGQPTVTALVYDSGEGPLGVFGPGTFDSVLKLAGGVNAFADMADSYGQVSIEEVATREIDVFVVPDYGPDYTYAPSAEERAEWLIQTFPATAAAQNRRFVILPYQNFNPSAQNAEGVVTLAKGFYPELFE